MRKVEIRGYKDISRARLSIATRVVCKLDGSQRRATADRLCSPRFFGGGEGKKESGREKRSWRLEQRRQNNGRYGFRRRGKDILWLRFGGFEGWRNARDLLKLASRWLVFFFFRKMKLRRNQEN